MKEKSRKRSKSLGQKHLCYVLLTCGHPSEDGNMNVEMTYEGDTSMAMYLLQNAQEIMDQKEDEELGICKPSKILSIQG
jgi:hypothetical protein